MNDSDLSVRSGYGRPRKPQWLFAGCILTAASFLSGCVGDTTLLQENASAALRSARFQARRDLRCPSAEVTVESEKEVPGAPWGFLYSDYRIRAEGCGARAVYDVECRDGRLCEIMHTPR